MPASPPETRASLILRLQNADDLAAWDEFVGMYGPVIFRVARSRGFQSADAENLVQEVLLAVSQSVTQWLERDDRGSFRKWLLALARNHAVNMLTRRTTRSIGRNDSESRRLLDDKQAADEVSALIDIEYDRTVFRWAAERVRQVVAENTWQAFWLTHVEGLTIDQVAKQLGTRAANIYFGRSRVMSRIQEQVKQYEDSHD
ncbi:MAG: sigma-70 family RNA polymerase sigma factor [Planctomycetales bacterium]|nr:sigma-70 family RNA polymerase sigma factor [Planctomycetales bacterium]